MKIFNEIKNLKISNASLYTGIGAKDEMLMNVADIKFPIGLYCSYMDGNTIKDTIKYSHIGDINTLVKEVNSGDQHLCEILHSNTRKIYFDVDESDIKVPLCITRDETDTFLNTMKTEIETQLNIVIEPKDFIVLVNEPKTKTGEPTDMIHSIHIVINSYKMSCKSNTKDNKRNNQLKNLCDNIQTKVKYRLDRSVYDTDRCFRMIGQSKQKNGVKLVPYYDDQNINVKSTLICYNNKSKLIKYYYADYQDTNEQNKPLHSISVQEIIPFLIHGQDDCCEFDQHQFFNSLRDWTRVTIFIIRNPRVYDINDWITYSIEIAKNDKYTIDANKKFVDKIISNDKYHCSEYDLYSIINKYSSHSLSIPQTLRKHAMDNLKEIYDSETIKRIMDKIRQPDVIKYMKEGCPKPKTKTQYYYEFKTKFNVKSILNIKTGFITYENNAYDNLYCKNIPAIQEDIFKPVDTINDMREELLKFIPTPLNVFIAKSPWGTGKSSNLMKTLIHLKDDNGEYKYKRILMISESNAFNRVVSNDYGFVSHQDEKNNVIDKQTKRKIKITDYDRVVCSIQSLKKVKKEYYDLLIIDEFESVFSSYTGHSTFVSAGTSPDDAFLILKNFISSTNKVLILDADISEDKVSVIHDIVGKNNCITFKNNQKSFQDTTIEIVHDEQQFTNLMTQAMKDKTKIAFPTAVKKEMDSILNDLPDDIKNNNKILTISVDGAFIFNGGEKLEYNKENTIRDLEKFIIEHELDIFCYTPTIKTGISINDVYFDELYAFGSSGSILFTQMIQMLFRCRKLHNNKITLYLDGFTGSTNNVSYEYIERQQHFSEQKYKQMTNNTDNVKFKIYSRDEVDDEYYKVQTINNRNIHNSKNNYAFNVIQLFNYHNLNYVFIPNQLYCDLLKIEIESCILDIDIEEAKRKEKHRIMMEWIELPMLTWCEYIKIHQQVNTSNVSEKFNGLEQDMINRYYKTKTIFNLYSVPQIVLQEFSQYYIKDEKDNDCFDWYNDRLNRYPHLEYKNICDSLTGKIKVLETTLIKHKISSLNGMKPYIVINDLHELDNIDTTIDIDFDNTENVKWSQSDYVKYKNKQIQIIKNVKSDLLKIVSKLDICKNEIINETNLLDIKKQQVENTINRIVPPQFYLPTIIHDEDDDDNTRNMKLALSLFYQTYKEKNKSDNVFMIRRILKVHNPDDKKIGLNVTKQDKKVINHAEVEKVLKVLKCYDFNSNTFIPTLITNKEFVDILKENDAWIQTIYHERINKKLKFKATPFEVKEIYKEFRDKLDIIDIKMEYQDKNHTNRPSDKICITNKLVHDDSYCDIARCANLDRFFLYNKVQDSTTLDNVIDYKSDDYTYKSCTTPIPDIDKDNLNKLFSNKNTTSKTKLNIQSTLLENEVKYKSGEIDVRIEGDRNVKFNYKQDKSKTIKSYFFNSLLGNKNIESFNDGKGQCYTLFKRKKYNLKTINNTTNAVYKTILDLNIPTINTKRNDAFLVHNSRFFNTMTTCQECKTDCCPSESKCDTCKVFNAETDSMIHYLFPQTKLLNELKRHFNISTLKQIRPAMSSQENKIYFEKRRLERIGDTKVKKSKIKIKTIKVES
tara:strand:- start:754 stop:5526 length:4773 start_codon:yes stop_codon:yes gene_type:complete